MNTCSINVCLKYCTLAAHCNIWPKWATWDAHTIYVKYMLRMMLSTIYDWAIQGKMYTYRKVNFTSWLALLSLGQLIPNFKNVMQCFKTAKCISAVIYNLCYNELMKQEYILFLTRSFACCNFKARTWLNWLDLKHDDKVHVKLPVQTT